MPTQPSILIVEDDEVTRLMLESDLGKHYRVVAVASGEACLEVLSSDVPNAILLDVELPGMNGYETCQHIRAAKGSTIPVIFVSARDHIDDRLKGYEAGGNDYIVKPFEKAELLAKVELNLSFATQLAELRTHADQANRMTMSVISNLGEIGGLLQALQGFNRCRELDELAGEIVQTLSGFELNGLVRLTSAHEIVLQSTQGSITPIEESIIGQIAEMGRMVEYRSRFSVSYEHVVLVVTNMPIDDEERRGRLRDHLAILIEGAEVASVAISRGRAITRAVQETSQALLCIQDSEREMQIGAALAMQAMSDNLEKAYLTLALTDGQEQHLASIVTSGIEGVRSAMQAGTDILPILTAAIDGLKSEID